MPAQNTESQIRLGLDGVAKIRELAPVLLLAFLEGVI